MQDRLVERLQAIDALRPVRPAVAQMLVQPAVRRLPCLRRGLAKPPREVFAGQRMRIERVSPLSSLLRDMWGWCVAGPDPLGIHPPGFLLTVAGDARRFPRLLLDQTEL